MLHDARSIRSLCELAGGEDLEMTMRSILCSPRRAPTSECSVPLGHSGFAVRLIFPSLLLAFVLAAGPRVAYGQKPPAKASTPHVLSTVNGTPIGRDDVMYQATIVEGRKQQALTQDYLKKVLDGIIRDELIYQRAVALGHDADPGYQSALSLAMVQINAYKRKKLAEVFFRREVTEKAIVSDGEAQAYFAKNALRIRAELHVQQILVRKEAEIKTILKELKQGASFASVARRQFPNLPNLPNLPREPWDLGYLTWNQMPESWRNVVYDLKPGEHSGIIRGPNRRFWIVNLVERRENSNLGFADVEKQIKNLLKDAKVEQLRAKTLRDLRDKARIESFKWSVSEFEEKERN